MPVSFETLDLSVGDAKIDHTFLRQKSETRHLSVLFPGRGYTTQGPMLYYAGNLLADLGSDVLAVEYRGIPGQPSLQEPLALVAWISRFAKSSLSPALEHRPYERLTLVGKSLGTLAMTALLHEKSSLKPWPKATDLIWLTPLLPVEVVAQAIRAPGPRHLVVTGSADTQYYREDVLASFAHPIEQLNLAGADHGLDVEGDTQLSIHYQGKLMERISQFIAGDATKHS